eukprot:CAMPEP_0197658044 /NCGR_PEP_ID=MMETSP1338-20131121/44995_1 /TAXON_ID=43686 ORGANISM="Pelagodinium beii, Strain RCC1491" /NCGR_SAMPLE_ID=MMETSP1338 /ASSEMBLY_ACC=CAM_ASM_000754 /LENGTH=808 /DNA_ID=CAMNT_0043234543 /DNA_START=24 /DNA_END=2450 /DNA_ORIENTATION=-
MEFVSLVRPGGQLWKAWVACHYERRLKREDYRSANIKETCSFVTERLGALPIRCIGHVMLGLARLLLRKAKTLEERSDEVHNALLTSLSTGPGLPTVATKSAAALTLRPADEVPSLQLDGASEMLDMLLEPEMQDLEVEASLEEGRRHVAPIELITLSPGPATPPELPTLVLDDGFGAPSPEELASMAALDEMALQQGEATVETGKSAGAEELPAVDFLLGANSPSADTPPATANLPMDTVDDLMDGDLPMIGADGYGEADLRTPDVEPPEVEEQAEAPELPPVDFMLSTGEAETPEAVTPDPKRVVRALEFDTPVLSPGTARQFGPQAPRSHDLAQLIDLSPPRPSPPPRGALMDAEEPGALAALEPAKKRRRRKEAWLDDKTSIPERMYKDTGSITRATVEEYGIFLPHRNFQVGLTTTMSDICTHLSEMIQRAPDIAARQRLARAEAAERARSEATTCGGCGKPREAESKFCRHCGLRVEDALPLPAPLTPSRTPGSPGAPPPAEMEPPALPAATASEAEVEPPFSEAEMAPPEPTASEAEMEPPEPTASEAEMEPPASEAEVEPTASEAEMEPPASEAEVEPPASEAEVEPPASEAEVEAATDAEVEVLAAADAEAAVTAPSVAAVKVEGEEASEVPAFGVDEELVAPGRMEALQVPPEAGLSPDPSASNAVVAMEAASPKRPRLAPATGGATSPDQPAVQVKLEEEIGVDYATVSYKQGLELRETLGEASTLSFLGTVEAEGSAEAAACRFVNLLALHIKGAVSLEQESAYADITIGRGSDWTAWCQEDLRGVKREASDAGVV